MERAGFTTVLGAGFLTCILLAWQGFHGAQADWVSGFLCVLWSLLMLARLTVLTAPNAVAFKPHLARKIIHALHKNDEDRRGLLLRQSFNKSFAGFLLLGFAFCMWKLFCALAYSFPAKMAEFSQSVNDFFAAQNQSPLFYAPELFGWGQEFSYFLCLIMMGFLLRSYASDLYAVRSALLIIAGYAVAGWLLFFALSEQWVWPQSVGLFMNPPDNSGPSALVLKSLMQQTGIAGLGLLASLLYVPLGYVWISSQTARRDWVVTGCGTLAGAALGASLFVNTHPALGGFIFLCWMAVFMAWGACENQALGQTGSAIEQR